MIYIAETELILVNLKANDSHLADTCISTHTHTSIRMYLHVYYLYTHKDKLVDKLVDKLDRSLVDCYPRSKPPNLTDTPR